MVDHSLEAVGWPVLLFLVLCWLLGAATCCCFVVCCCVVCGVFLCLRLRFFVLVLVLCAFGCGWLVGWLWVVAVGGWLFVVFGCVGWLW